MKKLEQYGYSQRFQNEASMFPELLPARVISQSRGLYRLMTEQGEVVAEISGKMRHETDELAKFPAVGDFVLISPPEGESAVIRHILSRKSVFLRKAVGTVGQAQVVAANIDTVFICMSLNKNYNLNRLERYLAVAWDSGANPVVLLTKADLCDNLSEAVAGAERVSAFCDVIALSALEEGSTEKLAPYLAEGMTAAFIGSSGVGKSTLINSLLGGEIIKTAEIGKTDRGRHTTTGRELLPCPLGGVVIDTPGMRELAAESADFSKTFADVEELALGCKFSDCTHTSEPGCALLRAVKDGTLDRRRLDNYLKLQNEAGYDGLNSREIEAKKLERMFRDVGGIKGARSITKSSKKK